MKIHTIRTYSYSVVLAFAIAGYPLISFVPALLGVESRWVMLPFRGLVVVVALICSALTLLRKRWHYSGLVWLPFLLFWILYAMRIAYTFVSPPAVLARPAADFFLYGIGTCLLPALACFALADKPMRHRARVLTLWVTGCAASASIAHNAAQFGHPFGRVFGNEYLNPITLGHLGVSLILIVGFGMLQREVAPVAASLGLIAIGTGCLILSGSRGPLLALAVGLGLLATYAVCAGRPGGLVGAICVLAVLGPVGITHLSSLGTALPARVVGTMSNYHSEVRFDLYRGAWAQFTHDPWTGNSIVEAHSGSYPHNVLIEAFMATGILGGICFSTILIFGLVRGAQMVIRADPTAWIGILLYQHVLWAMFSGAIYSHSGLWCLLVSCIATASFPPYRTVPTVPRTRITIATSLHSVPAYARAD